MKSYNKELARAFHEIADLMAILSEDGFKIRAYRSAAQRISQERPITKKDTKVSLMQIPRIGVALAEKAMQYMQRGKIGFLEKLRRQIPKAVRDMLAIPHLGPNRVKDLFINLGIKNKRELLAAAKSGKIAELRGFGEKLVEQILDALQKGQQKKKRHSRAEVASIMRKLTKLLKTVRGIKKVEPAGSYRRGAPTVGDLDLLVVGGKSTTKTAEKLIAKAFPSLTILASGETKVAFVIFPQNLQVDIRFVPPESYGAALLYFTGSKDYNVMMRKVAIQKGYFLNEYGLFKDGEYIAGKTEREICKILELPYRAPRQRK